MSKLDASVVKTAYDRLAKAKAVAYQAHRALEATAEYRAARDADKELELAEDCLAGVQMLLSQRVV